MVAGKEMMAIEGVVSKVLLDEHADVIREAVNAIGGGDDGARGVRADRRRSWGAPTAGSGDAPQWLVGRVAKRAGRQARHPLYAMDEGAPVSPDASVSCCSSREAKRGRPCVPFLACVGATKVCGADLSGT